jgi:hypothetical protein
MPLASNQDICFAPRRHSAGRCFGEALLQKCISNLTGERIHKLQGFMA